MNNLFTLVKTNLRETLDKRKFKQNKKQQAFLVYIILMGVLFLGISILYNAIYSFQYVAAERTNEIYNLSIAFFALTTFMVFSSTISKMQSIFVGNDYEMLAALPIKKRDIVLSKIFNLYIIELMVCLILLIPNSVILTLFTQNFFYLILIPLAFVAPAFPMLVALLITSIIELIIKNQKIKTIISTVFTIVLLVGLMGFIIYSSFNSGFTAGGGETENPGQIAMFNSIAKVAIYINPSTKFIELAYGGNMLWILAYLGSNFLLLVLVLSIVVLMYTRIHNNMSISKANKKHKVRKNERIRVERTQRKEIAHLTRAQFFKSKNAVIQCGMGLIFGIVFAAAIAVGLNTVNIEPIEELDVPKFIYNNAFIFPVLLAFFIGILPPAATAISIEGRRFFILKSFPIDYKGYLKEKLKFSYLLMGIPSLIMSLILVIFIRQSVFSIIVSILFPQLYCFGLSAFTLFINATFPYLYWKNDIEVYKYHKSTVITVFGDMIISMFTMIGTIVLALFNSYASGAFVLVVFMAVSLVFYLILMNVTSKRIAKIEQEE